MSGSYASDIELAHRLAHGESAAVEEFCATYTRRVRLYVSARLADATDRDHDDLTQVIVISAIKSVHNYRGGSSLLTWLLSIARNKVADALKGHIKRRKNEISISEMVDQEGNEWDIPDSESANEPETAAMLSDLRGHIRIALGKLKVEYQEVLILHYIQDLPVAEIAQILRLNKRKVEYRLTEGRAAFRRALLELGMSNIDI